MATALLHPIDTLKTTLQVQGKEFRMLLVYVRRYFELLAMFDTIDTGEDRRVDIDEFKRAMQLLAGWGVKVEDPEAAFKEIDSDGGGQVLFDEFAMERLKARSPTGWMREKRRRALVAAHESSSVGAGVGFVEFVI